ncbi:hypothetical protein RD110_07720 [Rhodoferax koreense]|uniref:GGDEF domain-containing protein n=1 Tax=Rhodoferax koreensis TaxID=1842727 RepID=A0A1P8JTP1_9BURK|nr:hypothetical protein RD110_07720 [Rhodoferax koreense]
MSIRSCCLALVLAWSWVLLASAVARAEVVPLVTLDAAPGGTSLVGRIGYLEDVQGSMSIADIRNTSLDDRFAVPSSVVQQSGLDAHARWFKVRLHQAGSNGNWLIDSSNSILQHFSVYGPYDVNGTALAPPRLGDLAVPSAQPALDGDRAMYRFHLAQPGEYTLYLRAVSDLPQYYQWSVWDAVQFGQAEQGLSMYNGICYGLLLGMLIYNLMLLAVFREPLYGYHFLACLFAIVTIAALNGHLGRYLLADARAWVPTVVLAAPPLWIAFAALFCRSFLELPRYAPRLARSLLAFMPLCGLAVLLALLGPTRWALVLTQALSLATPVVMFAAAGVALQRGFRPAGWYLAALAVLFFAAAGVALNNFRVLDLPWHYDGLQFGLVVEITVLVVAMGSRIHLVRKLNGELGQKAEQLARDAQTDPLTGLSNRSGWTQHGRRLLETSTQAAVLLIDLDHFKPVNDQCGHAAGDKVLATVGQRLQSVLGGRDLAARLGGDEFAVLLGDTPDRAALQALVQRMIHLVAQPVPFDGKQLKVGCSIGIARFPSDGRDLSVLMHAADQAMYFVKKHGRGDSAFNEDTTPATLAAA